MARSTSGEVHMSSVRRRTLAVLLALAGLFAVPITAHAADPPVARLGVGQSVFWSGRFVESGHVEDDNLCGTAGPCIDYALDLARAGYRLRVAIDQPNRENTWTVTVYGPTGN